MPATFLGASLDDEGVEVQFDQGGARAACRARVLVNAAGPWATQVARAVTPAIQVPDVDLVQGTHIVLPMRVSAGIYYVESPADGRAIFIMPWKGETLIGTTETPYQGDPDQVRPLPEEEEYLLNVARHYFSLGGLHDPGRHPRALRGPSGAARGLRKGLRPVAGDDFYHRP